MPHLTVEYSGNLERLTDMGALCHALHTSMMASGLFELGAIRVRARACPHYAVADGGVAGQAAGGTGDYAFVYLNLRMGRGRSEATQQRAGQNLLDVAKAFFAPVMAQRHIGITLQIDVGPEVFDAKLSNLHPLFNKV